MQKRAEARRYGRNAFASVVVQSQADYGPENGGVLVQSNDRRFHIAIVAFSHKLIVERKEVERLADGYIPVKYRTLKTSIIIIRRIPQKVLLIKSAHCTGQEEYDD